MRSPDRQSTPGIFIITIMVVALGPALLAQAPASSSVADRAAQGLSDPQGSGTTRIDLRGSALLPAASGVATLQHMQGATAIHVEANGLPPSDTFDPRYVIYVAWAITPVGDAVHLGEVEQSDDHWTLDTTTDLESFALLVTAEPDFAVSQPSDAVVLVSVFANDTSNNPVSSTQQTTSDAPTQPSFSPGTPLEFQQAYSALEMARMAGGETYAPNAFRQAEKNLQQAEVYLSDPDQRDAAITLANEAAQAANDARLIADSSKQEAEYEAERQAIERELELVKGQLAEAQDTGPAAALPPQPNSEAEQERENVVRTQNEEQNAQAAEILAASRLAGDREKTTTDLEAAQETNATIERRATIPQQAAPAELDPTALRAQLQQQLNAVLETRQTDDSLIVSLPDDSFFVNAASMKPETRDMLAQVVGVLLAHPGLTLDVRPEGQTASSYAELHRQNLSKRRARAVAAFLISLGLDQNRVESIGFAEPVPGVEDRSVELVITGDAIASTPTA